MGLYNLRLCVHWYKIRRKSTIFIIDLNIFVLIIIYGGFISF